MGIGGGFALVVGLGMWSSARVEWAAFTGSTGQLPQSEIPAVAIFLVLGGIIAISLAFLSSQEK